MDWPISWNDVKERLEVKVINLNDYNIKLNAFVSGEDNMKIPSPSLSQKFLEAINTDRDLVFVDSGTGKKMRPLITSNRGVVLPIWIDVDRGKQLSGYCDIFVEFDDIHVKTILTETNILNVGETEEF